MAKSSSVKFRGQDMDVEYEYDYDPSVGIDGVSSWWFVGLSPEENDALGITQEEDDAIAQELTDMDRHDAGCEFEDNYF